jgi:hypothetical protein
MHTDLVEVAHGELCRGKLCLRCTAGILVRQLLVLRKLSLVPTEEPFADGHVRFGLSLTRSQRVVMHGKDRVEVTAQAAEFVGRAHFELCFCKPEVGSFFNVLLRSLLVVGEIDFWNTDLGQLSSLEHAQHVGSLGCILIRGTGRLFDQMDSPGKILRLSMLPQKSHHTQAVVGSRVSGLGSSLVMLQRLDRVVRLLELHAHSVFCPCVSLLRRTCVTPEGLLFVLPQSKLAKLEPHAAHELCFRVVLIGQKAHDIHSVDPELVLHRGSDRTRGLKLGQALLVQHGRIYVRQRVLRPRQLHLRVIGVEHRQPGILQHGFLLIVGRRDIGRSILELGERGEIGDIGGSAELVIVVGGLWLLHWLRFDGGRLFESRGYALLTGRPLAAWGLYWSLVLLVARGSRREVVCGRVVGLRGGGHLGSRRVGFQFHVGYVLLHILGHLRHNTARRGSQQLRSPFPFCKAEGRSTNRWGAGEMTSGDGAGI